MLRSFLILAPLLLLAPTNPALSATRANRLTYLDGADPFHVGLHFPRLTTPQWIGEPDVDAVVTFGIDDLRSSENYEAFLRPILERLKQIDGRAPVSIFCIALDPSESRFQTWLAEGLSLEVHTLNHPCPILAKGDFAAAQNAFHGGVELLNAIPNNTPVAFRTPCCDSMNSPSPRLYAELLCRTNRLGQFLRMDSSVLMMLTAEDPALRPEWVTDPDGRPKFLKYVPFPDFVTTARNYPYPWIVNGLIWEFPCMAPSDWEGQNILGNSSPTMLEDWKRALDAAVAKQGLFNFVFHPHGWSKAEQFVEFIDYAVATYGRRVRFLTYPEAHERLTRNLGAGQALRADDGSDNGVRLIDLNQDGYLDVVIGNASLRRTRVWDPAARSWRDSDFPATLAARAGQDSGARFGVLHADGRPSVLVNTPERQGAWTFENGRWVERADYLRRADSGSLPHFAVNGRDQGARLRDVDHDGICELLVSRPTRQEILRWDSAQRAWTPSEFSFPPDTQLVTEEGADAGMRFVDVNEDGYDDLVFSGETHYGVWLYQREFHLGWNKGWTRKTIAGRREGDRGAPDEIPPFVRPGPHRNNGAWFHSRHVWIQNEDTAHLPAHVDRRSFDDLLRGALPAPLPPDQALRTIHVRPGFEVELVAAEPLVVDPVAFDWDARGRLWVVEMRDYPNGVGPDERPGGVVKMLEDTDNDGIYDRATEFLRDLPFPTGILPWRDGCLISAAPQILFAADTDGDGRADARRALFEGFVPGNQQHRVNGFTLGLDGWIYGANGDSGGAIHRPSDDRAAAPATVSIRGSDFRFHPDTGAFEAIEGQTQFGRRRDDWGNWFGNANYTWLWHYPWPARYLARNDHLRVRDLRHLLATGPGRDRVFPRSRPLPRPNAVGDENTVTSACSPAPYRDDLFGPEFATSVFIAEPTENLVHREVLSPRGAGFRSDRPSDETETEFLASTDNWFRPVFTRTGPDGALYIADMYRLVIEHPEWIPPDLKSRINVRAGEDRGRIYRVRPAGVALRPIPRLQDLDVPGLIAALDTPNGWQRDTAMRLLVERADPAAPRLLRDAARKASHAQGRLQALATLAWLNALDADTLLAALNDPHPGVTRLAVELAERVIAGAREPLSEQPAPGAAALVARLLELARHSDPHVLRQVAFTLGEIPEQGAGSALLEIAARHPGDSILQTAVLSSARPHSTRMLDAIAAGASAPPSLLAHLAELAVAADNPAALRAAVLAIQRMGRDPHGQFTAIRPVLARLNRKAEGRDAPWSDLKPILKSASSLAQDPATGEATRIAAIHLLGLAPDELVNPGILISLLQPIHAPAIQQAALRAVGDWRDAAGADRLIRALPALGPITRPPVLELLLGRAAWTARLLDALDRNELSARHLGVAAQERLRRHADAAVRARADALLAAQSSRASVLESFASVATLSGDSRRGADVFREHCASCHKLNGVGFEVGPDIAALTDRSTDALLIAILDPNRAVEDRYQAWIARTADGVEFTGILVSESPASATLRNAAGIEEVFLRSNLASLTPAGHSLMPEGFEIALSPSDMADLLAWIQGGDAGKD